MLLVTFNQWIEVLIIVIFTIWTDDGVLVFFIRFSPLFEPHAAIFFFRLDEIIIMLKL